MDIWKQSFFGNRYHSERLHRLVLIFLRFSAEFYDFHNSSRKIKRVRIPFIRIRGVFGCDAFPSSQVAEAVHWSPSPPRFVTQVVTMRLYHAQFLFVMSSG
jgi:hypothetical protein